MVFPTVTESPNTTPSMASNPMLGRAAAPPGVSRVGAAYVTRVGSDAMLRCY